MGVAVPTDAEQLTPAWLSAALAEGGLGEVTVSSVTAERIAEGVGFIGQLHRLRLEYSSAPEDAPTSLIAKMPTNDPGGRMMGNMLRLYEKESGFYRHLVDDCPMGVARCFYNGAEPDDGLYCLLLEDLGHLEAGDQLRPRTLDETTEMLTIMGTIHGTWSDGRGDHHDWLPAIDDASSMVMLGMFEDAYPVTMERYGHIIPEYMHDWGPRFAPVAADWVADFARQPSTIIHGDFRTDNFLFTTDGTATVLLDWQLTSRAPGAYDVYYFLAMCPDADEASANLDALLDHYLDAFASAGGTPPDRDTLLDQMRGVGMWLTTLGIVTMSQLDPANTRGEELFLSMWRRGLTLAETIDLSPKVP